MTDCKTISELLGASRKVHLAQIKLAPRYFPIASRSFSEPVGASQNFSELFGASQSFSEPLGASRSLPALLPSMAAPFHGFAEHRKTQAPAQTDPTLKTAYVATWKCLDTQCFPPYIYIY